MRISKKNNKSQIKVLMANLKFWFKMVQGGFCLSHKVKYFRFHRFSINRQILAQFIKIYKVSNSNFRAWGNIISRGGALHKFSHPINFPIPFFLAHRVLGRNFSKFLDKNNLLLLRLKVCRKFAFDPPRLMRC